MKTKVGDRKVHTKREQLLFKQAMKKLSNCREKLYAPTRTARAKETDF